MKEVEKTETIDIKESKHVTKEEHKKHKRRRETREDCKKRYSSLSAVKVALIFFGILLFGTVVSRLASSMLTPVVEAEYVSSGTIEHNILADVTVSGDRKVPVYVCSGVLVEEVYVSEGEVVEKGDKLLWLNTDSLQEIYLKKKIARKGMKLQYWYASDDERVLDELKMEMADTEIAQLETHIAQEGIVYASFGGMISEVRQNVGSKSIDEAAVVITQEADTYTLKISVSQTQKNYIAEGDNAIVQAGEISVSSEVTAVYEEIANPQHYIVEVQVPGDVFHIGDSVLVNIVHVSKKYDFVIPVSAIRSDTTGNYVLVLREKETLLGTEQIASKVQIKIGETNEEYVGANSDALSINDKIIISSNKQIDVGDTVREK